MESKQTPKKKRENYVKVEPEHWLNFLCLTLAINHPTLSPLAYVLSSLLSCFSWVRWAISQLVKLFFRRRREVKQLYPFISQSAAYWVWKSMNNFQSTNWTGLKLKLYTSFHVQLPISCGSPGEIISRSGVVNQLLWAAVSPLNQTQQTQPPWMERKSSNREICISRIHLLSRTQQEASNCIVGRSSNAVAAGSASDDTGEIMSHNWEPCRNCNPLRWFAPSKWDSSIVVESSYAACVVGHVGGLYTFTHDEPSRRENIWNKIDQILSEIRI